MIQNKCIVYATAMFMQIWWGYKKKKYFRTDLVHLHYIYYIILSYHYDAMYFKSMTNYHKILKRGYCYKMKYVFLRALLL